MEPDTQGKDRSQYTLTMTLAGLAGQVGCLTLVVIFAALFAGLWLDNTFDTKPAFTLVLLLAGIPVSVILMLNVIRRTMAKLKSQIESQDQGNSA